MIKNKLLSVLALTIFISLSPITFFAQELKPDLIITSVTSRTFIPENKHKPGEPVSGGGNRTLRKYTITIKNIGTKDFSKPFSIAWKHKPYTDDQLYTRVVKVNEVCDEIPVGGSLDFEIIDGVSYEHDECATFLIKTNDKQQNGSSLSVIEELNYDNNTYMY